MRIILHGTVSGLIQETRVSRFLLGMLSFMFGWGRLNESKWFSWFEFLWLPSWKQTLWLRLQSFWRRPGGFWTSSCSCHWPPEDSNLWATTKEEISKKKLMMLAEWQVLTLVTGVRCEMRNEKQTALWPVAASAALNDWVLDTCW